jgi:hypothetical protein
MSGLPETISLRNASLQEVGRSLRYTWLFRNKGLLQHKAIDEMFVEGRMKYKQLHHFLPAKFCYGSTTGKRKSGRNRRTHYDGKNPPHACSKPLC